MSRRIEFLVLFVVAFGTSWMTSWVMDPDHTGLRPWLVTRVGEGWAQALRYLVVGLVAALIVWLIRSARRPRQGSDI